jgi:acyl-CoA thioesterase II
MAADMTDATGTAQQQEQQQRQESVDEFLELLRLERQGDEQRGRTPDWYGPIVFGGIGLALTVRAACNQAPPDTRLNAIHAHFLRPVQGGRDILFRNDVLKAGRTISLHAVTASQNDKPVITMTCSFTSDTDGYVYDVSGIPADVPPPDELPENPPHEDHEPGPFETRWLGPSALRADGTREATHRHWFRFARALDDDPHLHTALLGYATDWTGIGGRPLHLDGDTTGMVSLDHAAWFHRRARADEWLLQDVQSLVNAGGRGTLRGVIRATDGQIVASMAQEMLLQPIE